MRKRDLLYTVFACVMMAVAGPSLAQDDEIRWLDNYPEAIQEAKRTQKPIFLEFRCEP
ncbi:MAG: thioredoxin family protein [Acidobacteria bacterium]|nr:thioredoxin family protein [Acidobacteriota bacterium]MCI0717790.1 thioredoxin family protein [Acidobacteriota bacterium]